MGGSSTIPGTIQVNQILTDEEAIINKNLLRLSSLFFKSISNGIKRKQFSDLVSDHVNFIHSNDNCSDTEKTLANEILANDQLGAYDHILGSYSLSTDSIDIMKKIVSIVKNNADSISSKASVIRDTHALLEEPIVCTKSYTYPLFAFSSKDSPKYYVPSKFAIRIREFSEKPFNFSFSTGANYFHLTSECPLTYVICEWFHQDEMRNHELIFSITSLADYKVKSNVNTIVDLNRLYTTEFAIRKNANLLEAYANILDFDNSTDSSSISKYDSKQKYAVVNYLINCIQDWAPSFLESLEKKYFLKIQPSILHNRKFRSILEKFLVENKLKDILQEDDSEIQLGNFVLSRKFLEYIERNLGLAFIVKGDCLDVSSSHSFQVYCDDIYQMFLKECIFQETGNYPEKLSSDYDSEYTVASPLIYDLVNTNSISVDDIFKINTEFDLIQNFVDFREIEVRFPAQYIP